MNRIVITGQTATGKTRRAIRYAQETNGELVAADSRHIYTHLDIVTGKDTQELKASGVPFHMVDVVTPDKSFSSYEYVRLASACIADIIHRKKTPIIVGGTYLYIQQLVYGRSISVPANEELRAELSTKSIEELQHILLHRGKQVQREITMNNSDWHNPRRLIRRIEILQQSTDSNLTAEQHGHHTRFGSKNSEHQFIGLRHSGREALVAAITERVEARLTDGALDEVRALLRMGYTKTDPGLQAIGYGQLIAHIEGQISLDEAKAQWITKEVQYAKRQLTFMKRNLSIQWETVD